MEVTRGRRRRPMEREYAQLVEHHRDELHAPSRRILRSSQDAEDALQEALLRGWRALPSFEGLFLYYPGHRRVPAPLRAFIDMVRVSGRRSASGKNLMDLFIPS